ncbi:MAG: diaminopimelate decarboxylase, partial [Pseudomonadota bacterium]
MREAFHRGSDGTLYAEDVSLTELAADVGTPFYVYAAGALRRQARAFREPFSAGTVTAFSVKALSNIAVLALLRQEGFGADVVSGGELDRALHAGIAPHHIVYSGVGKTRAELQKALSAEILQFNVESVAELKMLSEIASSAGQVAPVAIRINPDIDAETLPGIATGRADDKFGVPWDRASEVYDLAAQLPGIDPSGLDLHIGSQIMSLKPFEGATRRAADLVHGLRERGLRIDRLDLGGGLGIPYREDDEPPEPADYAQRLAEMTDALQVQLILEPGRVIVGNAGLLVTRITLTKSQTSKDFVVVDAGMNDLIRPALYGARHDLMEVTQKSGERQSATIVGPICESTDDFGSDYQLTAPQEGDLLAFKSAGAYGAVQASEYNTRP